MKKTTKKNHNSLAMSIKVVFQHMSEIRGKIYAHVCVCIHIYALACFYQYNKIVL